MVHLAGILSGVCSSVQNYLNSELCLVYGVIPYLVSYLVCRSVLQ